MLNVTIRDGEIQDWEEIQELDAEVFPDERLTKENYQEIYERQNSRIFLAIIKNQISGYLILTVDETICLINRVGVRPTHQRKGIGTVIMRNAIYWAKKTNQIRQLKLYVLSNDLAPNALYQKVNFAIAGKAWHFIIRFDQLEDEKPGYRSSKLKEDEIPFICQKFSLNEKMIQRFLKNSNYRSLILRRNSEIIGYCRFAPSFPGAKPFILLDTNGFDSFSSCIKAYSKAEFNYFRITFEDNEELASLCSIRGYKLHHELYYMTRDV